MTYLIDTNVLSELPKRNPDPKVVSWISSQKHIVISAITVEELSYGLERLPLQQAGRLKQRLEKLLSIPPVVVSLDAKIAHNAGFLRAARQRAGRVVAQADMLIAATALSTGRILVTSNVKDFQDCGIPLLNPLSVDSKL